MAVFKATKNKKDTNSGTFKATERKSYDSTIIYDWETTNKSAIDIINSYNKKLQNNEYLSAKDIADYQTAVNNYVNSSTKLRELGKSFGQTYTEEEEKSWTDNITNIKSTSESVSNYYSHFTSENAYKSYLKDSENEELYNKYLTEYNGNSEAGMAGFEQYNADRSKQLEEHENNKKDVNGDGKVSWWEKALSYLADGTASDTSLPMAGASQVESDLREYGKGLDTTTWSDEQKALFGNLYATDQDEAFKVADIINKINKDAKLEEIGKSATNGWEGFGHAVAAIFASTTGIVDTLSDLVEYNALGSITHEGYVTPHEYSQAVTSSISSKLNELGTIDEDFFILGGKGLGDVYSLGTSILQSALTGSIGGGWGSLIMLGGSAAASGIDDALARGATDAQAIGYGLAVGLAEGIAEKIGIDNLTNLIFKKGSTTLLKTLVKQSIAEGAEEGVTAFANAIFDNAIMRDKSNFNALVNQYTSQGMSESEAQTKAWIQHVGDIAFDMIGGAISGGVHTVGAMAINKGINTVLGSINANQLYGNSQQELIDSGLEFGEGSEQYNLAKKYQDKLNNGKNLSGGQLYNLSQTIEKAILSEDTNKIKTATEARLKELGETTNTSELAETLTKWIKGEELSKNEKKFINNSKYGRRVANELNPENIKSSEFTSDWTGNIGTERINTDLYNLAQEVAGVTEADTVEAKNGTTIAEVLNMQNRTTKTETPTKKTVAVSDDGKTTIIKDGERVEVSVNEIASIEDGKVSVRLNNGEVVDINDVEFGTEEEGLIYEAVADMNMNAATANSFIKGFKEGKNSPDLRISQMSAKEYIDGFNEAYKYGTYGFSSTDISKEGFAASLTESQRNRAYELGRIDRENAVKSNQSNVDKKIEAAKKTTVSKTEKVASKKQNRILSEDGTEIDLKKLKAKATKGVQKTGIEVIEFLTSVLSGKYYVFESYKNSKGQLVFKDADGIEQPAPNGFFRGNDGSLHIDLNAGEGDLQGIMLNTLAHEQGHYIAEKNPEGFKLLSDYIVNYLNKKGIDVDALVKERLEKKRAKGRYEGLSETKAYDEAFEDVICDGLSTVYYDGEVLNMINELKTTEKGKGLIQQLFEKLKELINNIVNAYKKVSGRTEIGNHIAKMSLEEMRGLQKIFSEALVKADEAHAAIGTAENTTKSGELKFQLRETVEETKELIAVHNMQVSELNKSLDLGGLPMPSIAIIKAKSGHSEYGDVSIVFNKSTIDPKVSKYNKLYGGDAWTPVYPKIEYKPRKKVVDRISKKYYELSKKVGHEETRPIYNYVYDTERMLDNYKGEENLLASLYEDTDMMQLFLHDTGKGKIETVQKETRTELSDAEVEMHEFFIKELGESVIDEIKAPDGVSLFNHRKNYLDKYETQIKETYRKLLTDVYHFTAEEVQNVLNQETDYTLLKKVRDANVYRQKGRLTIKTEPDYSATREAIKNATNSEEYRGWIDSLFKGIYEKSGIRNNKDFYTDSGNQRSWEALHWENNLENVIKVMRSQNNGEGVLFSGLGIWGVSAKEYSSISEMKADSSRLTRMNKEEYEAIKESFGERFNEIASSIMSKSERNQFIALDNAMECIVDAVRSSKTASGILRNLKQYTQLSVTETTVRDIISLVSDISNMPTEYFEAKPQRAVGFDEIATVILPDNAEVDLKNKLRDMGIKSVEYKSGDENARLEALNSIEDVKFSDRDSDYMKAVESGDEVTAQRMVDQEARAKGYNSPKLYHGTPKFGFSWFDLARMDDGISIFATTNETVAGTYSGRKRTLKISENVNRDEYIDKLTQQEVVTFARRILNYNITTVKEADREYSLKKAKDSINQEIKNIEKFISNRTHWYNFKKRNDLKLVVDAFKKMVEMNNYQELNDYYENDMPNLGDIVWDNNLPTSVQDSINQVRFVIDNAMLPILNSDTIYQFYGDEVFIDETYIKNTLKNYYRSGIYSLYGKVTDKFLTIDNKGENWDKIEGSNIKSEEEFVTTRDVAKYAKANGYDGVIFKNIYDNGGQLKEYKKSEGLSNIYIFFNPNDLKSADPVTYDDNGKVIPLSQRYDDTKNELRYSDRDSDGNTLSKEQQEYFKDSKIRDKDGNLLVVYHGSKVGGFTQFKTELEGSYFTADRKYAEEYAKGNGENVYSVYLNITKPFDTRAAKARKIFEEEFYGQWGNGAPLTERGLLDWTDGADMFDFIQEKGYDYDGVIIDEGGTPDGNGGIRDRGISYVAFYREQVKNTTNKTPTSNPDIRYSDRDNAPNDFNPKGETLKEQLEDAYSTSESFDQRYVYVGRFTDSFRSLLKDNDIIVNDYPVAMNYRDAYLSMHSKETGKYHGDNINYHDLGVEGLEAALESIKSPINILKSKKDKKIELVLQSVDKKGNSILSIVAINQKPQNGRQFLDVHIVTSVYGKRNIDKYIGKAEEEGRLIKAKKEESSQGIPQVQYKGNINDNSSNDSISPKTKSVNKNTENSDTKFQDRDPDLLAQREKVIEVLAKETDKLREDNQYLKDLVKLQRKVTHGTMFTKSSVEAVAGKLSNHAGARGNKAELVKLLNDYYGYIAKAENLAWEDIAEKAQPVIDWLKKNKVERPAKLDAVAQKILKELRDKRIYLSEDQQSEAAYVYGSFYEFRKKAMGSLTIVNKNNSNGAIALESFWMELSETYPMYFDPETIAASMPARMMEVIDSLRNFKEHNEYNYSDEMVEQDLLTQVYDSYWDVSTLHTVADSMQKKINLLKHKHNKKMAEVKEYHNEKHNQLKKEYRDKISRIKNDYRERQSKVTRELLNRAQESRKKAAESRNKTEMRHKIKKVVSKLNQLLLRPTKDKHINEELLKAVAESLFIINMDTVGAEERVAKYDKLIAQTKDPDMIAELTLTRNRIELQGETLKEKLDALKNAYEKIKNSQDVELVNAYQETILNSIKNVSELAGNTPIRYMSFEQLEAVYDMYSMIHHAISTANKMFKAKKGETITQTAEKVNTEIRRFDKGEFTRVKGSKDIRSVKWALLKPLIAFRTIGSETFTDMYNEIRNGEDVYYNDISEAKSYIQGQYKQYNYKGWDTKKTWTFEDKTGDKFTLNLEQIMSLYAYSRREQALAHIMEGGIVLKDNVIVKKNKLGIPIKYEVDTTKTFSLSEDILYEICNTLTKEQKAYVESMQGYLSNNMGAKGNEVSMELLGIKLFKEQYYFPLKSSQDYMNFQPQEAGEIKLKNSSFSKETVNHANNPIVLNNFTDIWSEHVHDMSMYHAFVLPLEDFTRVFNYKTKTDAQSKPMSTKQTLSDAHGDGAITYIRNFLTSLNGGVRVQNVGIVSKFTSLTKKSAVLASASVAIQQPSAIIRAMAYINPIYFVASTHKSINLINHKKVWAELKQYAPIAGIKEMGRFDVGMGQDTVSWIKDQKTFKEKADDVLSVAPAYMDEITWVSIWEAVKKEVAAKNKSLNINSEEFLKKCGERFSEVVSLSQVYDSVFSRSDIMRNKNDLAKMLTAFMAEPTTTLNMLWDSLVQGKRTGNVKGFLAKTSVTTGAILGSIVFNSLLKSIITAMRDDDDDESYLEKYVEALVGNTKDNANPLTYIPFVKDIVSIFEGYDVERMDMALFSDLHQALEALDSESKTEYEKWTGLIGAISAFAGIPFKNVERDIRGAYNTIKSFIEGEKPTKTGVKNALKEGWTGKEVSKTQQLYEAIMSGEKEHIDRVKARFEEEGKTEKEIKSAIESAMRKGLRDNDPRIREAAQAVIDGNQSERVRITREIKAEGKFSQDIIVGAINAEITALKKKLEEAK